jgi:hypothetical protein
MKSTVFVRPNLKMILLGAILLLIVQHFIANGHSQATQIYHRISAGYERRGEYRKAVLFLRRAEKLSQIQDAE